jgi:2-keto-4-pentenoate hydratase/2-oxohepta-3-ene-1,7-dioic acid hydratase in catechol pathway
MGSAIPVEPLIFLKPSTAVIGPEQAIEVPSWAGRVDHEAEVAVVIGARASRVPAARASDYILGVTAFNDVTARALQRQDGQWTRGKGFDTFAPIGPCIAVGLDAGNLSVRGEVNGVTRQNSSTRELIFPIPRLIEFVTSVMTLLPGDVIATGTPGGIGPLEPGDRVTIYVEGVGALTNPVVARAD